MMTRYIIHVCCQLCTEVLYLDFEFVQIHNHWPWSIMLTITSTAINNIITRTVWICRNRLVLSA